MKINRNFFAAEFLVSRLYKAGVRDVCISPGSRSTPLVFAFDKEKRIRKHIIVDERAAAFFALGLAKGTLSPVAMLCTSGTAVAEYYPALIEAFQTRVKLIAVTADRPAYLRNTGENQCINQENIFANHIRAFIDTGLPELSLDYFGSLDSKLSQLFSVMNISNPGPVHINFPCTKPFEPDACTDEVSDSVLKSVKNLTFTTQKQSDTETISDSFGEILKTAKNPLIVIGRSAVYDKEVKKIETLASILNAPVLADITSRLRYTGVTSGNVIFNYDSILRSGSAVNLPAPGIVLHFGGPINSLILLKYLAAFDAPRFMINEFGDWTDPSMKSITALKNKPSEIISYLKSVNYKPAPGNKKYLTQFIELDKISDEKNSLIPGSKKLNEINLINCLLETIEDYSVVMSGNSLAIRDFDNFSIKLKKRIEIFSNRGASGIDGIISTASGIAAGKKKRVWLVTGDLSLLYDLNAFLLLKKSDFDLSIILINNGGGGIFSMLPVSKHEEIYQKYFKAGVQCDFNKVLKGMSIPYSRARDVEHFKKLIRESANIKGISVIEVRTSSAEAKELRNRLRSGN